MIHGVPTPLARLNNEVHDALELLSEYGVVSVRRKRRGEIVKVKHVTLGWMSAADYALYRGTKKAMATYLPSLIRSGYELKAWIWGSEVNLSLEFIASGAAISIPGGAIVVAVALVISVGDFAEGNDFYGWVDIAAIFLPFGELWLFWRGFDLMLNLPNFLTNEVLKGLRGAATLKGGWSSGSDPAATFLSNLAKLKR